MSCFFANQPVVRPLSRHDAATRRRYCLKPTKLAPRSFTEVKGWSDPEYDFETWRPVSTFANLVPGTTASALNLACSYEWDVLRLRTAPDVIGMACQIFEQADVLSTLDCSQHTLLNFCQEIGKRYLPNFYHNIWHGTDVLFHTWRLLQDTKVLHHLNELEVIATLIAAFGHDVGHPGLNNAFLVKVRASVALLHNDRSVLENMHSAIVFDVLRSGETALLANLNDADWRAVRGITVPAILGTDMAHHFKQTSALQVDRSCLPPPKPPREASHSLSFGFWPPLSLIR